MRSIDLSGWCNVVLMESHTIEVNIVDSLGAKQTFQVERLGLDCGSGLIEIRPDEPAFFRGFDRGVLTLDEGDTVTTMTITGGMASLTGKSVHVVCEKAIISSPDKEIPPNPETESKM